VSETAGLLALAAAVFAAVAFAAARARANRDLSLERMRARIAADLHDDIGSSLARISILSEVARLKAGSGEAAALLGEIAETSRSLVGSMSDAVWSIDPAEDDLGHVVARMRAFATDVLDGKGVAWTFDAPGENRTRLAPETRRELFLVFKEAVTNVARHSGARVARLRLEVLEDALTLEVGDDGKGFAPGPAPDLESGLRRGRGLVNMQARAARMGGSLSVISAPGIGVRLDLVLPRGRGKKR
jgi:signal transduction histidine kinase